MDYYGLDKFVVFVFGAIIGSFINVCIYRMPRNKSIVFPASHCPRCKKSLHWYDNIPILSYMVLLGRCSFCGRRISIRYPIVEVLTAALLVALYVAFGVSAKFFTYSALVSALIVVTFIDIDFQEIPDSISLGGMVAGLALSAAVPAIFDTNLRGQAVISSLLGILAGGGSIYAMGVFGKLAFKKDAMGGGDVKLMAMIGSFIGWKLVLLTFFIAPVFGAVIGVILKMREGRETIAYAPYLSLAAIVSIFYGDNLIRLFLYGM